MTRTRITRNRGQFPGWMPWVLEYRDGGEWTTFGGGFNTRTAAAWQAHSVFGAPRPGTS